MFQSYVNASLPPLQKINTNIFKMVKMVNLILGGFSHNKTDIEGISFIFRLSRREGHVLRGGPEVGASEGEL